MTLKNLLAQLHLYLGLSIGILFFVIALSGALYTWAPEISRIIYHQNIEPQDKAFVPISSLVETLAREFPEGDFRTAFYRDASSTAEVLLYAPGTYFIAQLNPYTGELVHLQDMNKGWLNYVKFLHRNLILGDVGRQIVHWVTLLSLPMLITGIVIWWPAKRKSSKQRFRIKWSASPKRLNYDLHNVLGFYATWILLFSVITGIFWGFTWVRDTLSVATGENTKVYEIPQSDTTHILAGKDQFVLMDSLLEVYRSKFPDKNIRISNPHRPEDPINISLIDEWSRVYTTDHFFHDRNQGNQLQGNFNNGLHTESSTFHTMHGLVYDVHLGNVFGLTGKLLVFFASLIAASLPITGFVIWLGKRKKAKSSLKVQS